MKYAQAPAFHTLGSNKSTVQFFPFGRGDRGSRQRVFVEFSVRQGRMLTFTASLKVGQVVGAPLIVALVGAAIMDGKQSTFHRVDFRGALGSAGRALRDFRVTRRANKTIQAARARKLKVSEC